MVCLIADPPNLLMSTQSLTLARCAVVTLFTGVGAEACLAKGGSMSDGPSAPPLDDSAGMDWSTTVGINGMSHIIVQLKNATNVGVRVKMQFEDEYTAGTPLPWYWYHTALEPF